MFEAVVCTFVIGVAATAIVDLWAMGLRRVLRTPAADFRFVGRWIGHMPRGRFTHERIAAAPAIPGELALGWLVHYATGVVFAGVLVAAAGPAWLKAPTFLPAVGFGLLTVAAPFLIMQPAMGLGWAASRAPRPAVARVRSLSTHLIFGVGLFGSAAVCARLIA